MTGSRVDSGDFEHVGIEALRARGSSKWTKYPPDVLAMWVAEMDFPTAPPVLAAIRDGVEQEAFGYPPLPADQPIGAGLAAYCADEFGWQIDPAKVNVVPDVVKGMALTVDTYTSPGAAVIVTPPVYGPFFDVLAETRRRRVDVPLVESDDRWRLDLEGIDAAFADGAEAIMLCHPHNPTGTVHTRAELAALAAIVDRHGARVISDEIHAPLVLAGEHVPYAISAPEAAGHTVTVFSAAKAWNLPGLLCAQVITSTDADQATWRTLPMLRIGKTTQLGVRATMAAFADGRDWQRASLEVLRENLAIVREAVSGWDGVRLGRHEATYLAWLDFRGLQLTEEPAELLLREGRVALNSGAMFASAPNSFARLNFATSPQLLHEGLDRIATALDRR